LRQRIIDRLRWRLINGRLIGWRNLRLVDWRVGIGIVVRRIFNRRWIGPVDSRRYRRQIRLGWYG